MTNSTELQVARRNTRAFIQADPVVVQFSRPTQEDTAAGGVRPGSPQSVPAQVARLVPLSGNVWDRAKPTSDEGLMPDVTHQLIGMPNLDVKKNDEFLLGKDRWKVTHVSPERTVRTSANVELKSQDAEED